MSATLSAPADWWRSWRDRLIADPRFRHFAAAFPLTRPIARRRTRALFDLCAGFVYAQTLSACVDLDVFAILAQRPQRAEALARQLGLDLSATETLLTAAAGLHLVERLRDGRIALGQLGAAMVGNAGVAAMVRHHRLLYADLRDPVALLRGTPTALSQYWPYAEVSPETAAPYTALMAESQPLVAREVLDAYNFARHACVLDVAGGDGSFLAALARHTPGPARMLFDLPPVAERARARLGEGARIFAGDFRADPLPLGADLCCLIRVLHDHDDVTVLHLLRAIHAALPPGGTLLIGEPMAQTRGAESMGAYFALYLRAMGSGRPRSADALRALLTQAGFAGIRRRPTHTPLLASVLTAKRS